MRDEGFVRDYASRVDGGAMWIPASWSFSLFEHGSYVMSDENTRCFMTRVATECEFDMTPGYGQGLRTNGHGRLAQPQASNSN